MSEPRRVSRQRASEQVNGVICARSDHLPPVDAIGESAGDKRERELWQKAGKANQSKLHRRVGDRVDLPSDCGGEEGLADT